MRKSLDLSKRKGNEPKTEEQLPELFRRNTFKSLKALSMILDLKPDREDPNTYGIELRSLQTAATGQVAAQLKSDQNALAERKYNDFSGILERIRLAEIEEKALLSGEEYVPPKDQARLTLNQMPRVGVARD